MLRNLRIILLMNVFFKALKIVAVSWVTLTVIAAGLPDIVICFGADGHVALEIPHQKHCQDTADASGHGHHALVEELAHADCCDSCFDVSLSWDTILKPISDAGHSISSKDYLTGVLSAISFDTGIAVDVSLNAPCVLRYTPLRTSHFLLAQRTIVLRV